MKNILNEPLQKKSEWGPGPWQEEPDRVEFEYEELPCLLVRNTEVTGSWCGYVAVKPGHPYFEKGYQDLKVNVHGGLTYADHCQGHICHEPKPGEPDNVWWLGFDCSHAFDLMPRMEAVLKMIGPELARPHPWDKYRDINYVKNETIRLAKQLKAIEKCPPTGKGS